MGHRVSFEQELPSEFGELGEALWARDARTSKRLRHALAPAERFIAQQFEVENAKTYTERHKYNLRSWDQEQTEEWS